MVVFGGLYLLDSDDEEEGQQSSETAAEERRRERARPTPPVMAYLTPRPWWGPGVLLGINCFGVNTRRQCMLVS